MPRSTISRACWTAGEDRLFIARRIVRMAVEDIGLADPQALVSPRGQDAFDFLGSPEGELALAAGDDLPRHRPEIERRLHRLQGGDGRAKAHGSLTPPKTS